ncbi:MAG: DUF305 domain-containing protein [Acidimicrobiia bacterium]
MPVLRRFVAISAFMGLTVLVSACGGDDGGAASSVTTAASASASAFNDADVAFAQSMVPHHDQAIEMATLALGPDTGASAAVRALATKIQSAQGPEITMMNGWLDMWGKQMPMDSSNGTSMSSMGGMDSMGAGSGEGMMSAEEMASLGVAKGAAFDKMWLEMMTRHHQGAIAMAKDVQTKGADPAVRDLAGKMIAAQQAEIDEMTKLLAG